LTAEPAWASIQKVSEAFAYGIDIGKKAFHGVAVNRDGAVIQRAKFACETLHTFFDLAPKALIGMEACPYHDGWPVE